MGDCPDEDKALSSLGVYSSTFRDYVKGKPVLLYMYDLFLKYDLLESSAGYMPAGTEHSSDSTRPTRVRAPGAMPYDHHKRGRKGRQDVDFPNKPISIEYSSVQQEMHYYASKSMRLKSMKQSFKLAA